MFSGVDIIPMRTNTSVVVSAFCLDIVNSLFLYESKKKKKDYKAICAIGFAE